MLKKAYITRETFDPSSQRHLDSFDVFLKTGNWGEVQFYPELPFTDVPMTCLMRFAEYTQGVVRETVAERHDRIAAKGVIPWPNPKAIADADAAERKAHMENGNRLFNELRASRAASN